MKLQWKLFSFLFFLNATILCFLVFEPLAQAAKVVHFHPTGSLPHVQQVSIRFSTDMVPLGDPARGRDPVTFECRSIQSLSSSGHKTVSLPQQTTRWVDARHWVLTWEPPLPPGISCVFHLNSQFHDLSGAPLQGFGEYRFSTSGPVVLATEPSDGPIDPDQCFVIQTSAPIQLDSLEKQAYFEVEGLPDKITVKALRGKRREKILQAAIYRSHKWWRYQKLLQQRPGRSLLQVKELENFVVIHGTRRFPEQKRVRLHWFQTILSQTGFSGEGEQAFDFRVLEPFRADFSCQREAPDRPCHPLGNMQVFFNKSVPSSLLKQARLVAADGQTWSPVPFSGFSEPDWTEQLTFLGPFPPLTRFQVSLPDALKDDLGRTLSHQAKYPLEVTTDDVSPLIKFPASFGLLELKADPVLPLSVRRVEKQLPIQQLLVKGKMFSLSAHSKASEILAWYQKVQHKEDRFSQRQVSLLGPGQGSRFEIPQGSQERDLELVGIPLKKPGFYVVEVASPLLGEALIGKGNPMYVTTAALVTDMAVHFKRGRESSLVWVTQLSDARPVPGAKVSILDRLGKKITQGITNEEGLWLISKNLDTLCEGEALGERSQEACELFVFAEKGDDLSFVSSDWSKGLEPYRFGVSIEDFSHRWGATVMHTLLDRMVAQPGDLLQMKHFLRERQTKGFQKIAPRFLPRRVLIVHQGSGDVYTLPFEWDSSTGSALNEWRLPRDAKQGRYSILLSNKEGVSDQERDWTAQETGYFIVSDYRLPLMKALIKIQGEPLIQPSSVTADLSAQYLSGGPAKGLKVTLRASLQPGFFRPELPGGDFYSFFSNPLHPGIFSSGDQVPPEQSFLNVQQWTLKAQGGLLATVPNLPKITSLQQLALEMEYTDPNGEVKTAKAGVPLFPAQSIVGLRAEEWYVKSEHAQLKGIVVDYTGKPQSHQPFLVEAFLVKHMTHRQRLLGGFYSYDFRKQVTALGKICEGTSDDVGRFECAPRGLPSGEITFQAKTVDEKKRATYANASMYLADPGEDRWWVPSDSDRMDLLPKKSHYEPGEQAAIFVGSPFQKATALITVEREGILEAFVQEVQRDQPWIQLPIKGDHAPEIFVSALVLRGRVADPAPTGLVDLARPTLRMGLTSFKVGWKAHELLVNVKTSQQKYGPREQVPVSIQVKTATGDPLPLGAEVALVGVDEALLQLKQNTSWNLLEKMMGQRGLGVVTSSGQNQVVGRRHFGAKAKPPGGDGEGPEEVIEAREFFEPVLFWKPRIKLNAGGQATTNIFLNDAITRFKIVAIASAGFHLFGKGETHVEASKDLILYSGFAPVVREGDQLQNVLTVRNTTREFMKVALEVTSPELGVLARFSEVSLKPSEAKILEVPLRIPADFKEIHYRIFAKDSLTGTSDLLQAKMKVDPAVPERVVQASLFQLNKTNELWVQKPAEALEGRGSLSVRMHPSLLSSLEGVRSYMADYPYHCLEQQLSRSLVLDEKKSVERLIQDFPAFLDSDGLLKFFSNSSCGSASLTRFVMNILQENGYALPPLTQDKMIHGLRAVLEGRLRCQAFGAGRAESGEAKILYLDTLARYAAFSPELLTTVSLQPSLWKNETLLAWWSLLLRQVDLPQRNQQLQQVSNLLRSRMDIQGARMTLQEDLDAESRWKLLTSSDQELIGLLGIAMQDPSWKEDLGRLARGVLSRLRFGHWDTTLANAWGVTFLRRLGVLLESEKVTGETDLQFGAVTEKWDWKAVPEGQKKLLNWPIGSERAPVLVQWQHRGLGQPWVHFEMKAAVPRKTSIERGYRLQREVTPIFQAKPGVWQVGDVAHIELLVTALQDEPWVVVQDALPAGASHLGNGLKGSSELLDQAPVSSGKVEPWPTEYEEKSHSHFFAYAAFLFRGTYRLSYRIRLQTAGVFQLPPARVEAMYAPELFGEGAHGTWKVNASKEVR